MRRYLCLLSLTLSGSLVITACSSAQDDWLKARTTNTIAEYLAFLGKHPNDPHKDEATAYLLQLLDDADWKAAQSGSSLASYRRYVQYDPRGTHARDAHDQIAALERVDAWKNALADGSETALKAFLQANPLGPEADQARKRLELFNPVYRVSMGTFGNEAAARRKRTELQTRFPRVLKEVDTLVPGTSNSHYLVTSGLMDRRDAESVCA